MSFRIGECSSCGANYKLPATFAADQARCKNCGGVVQIGKVGAPGPAKSAPPVPASKPAASTAAKAPVEVSRPKKKREGPSMKERLMAERQSQADAAAKSASNAPKSGSQPKLTSKAVPTAAKSKAPAAPGSRRSGAAPSRASASRGSRGGSSRRRGGEEAEGDSGSRRGSGGGRRRGAPEKKKAPIGGIIALVVMIVGIGGGAFWYMGKDDAKDDAGVEAANNESSVELAQGEVETPIEDVPLEVSDDTVGSEDASADDASADADAVAAEAPKKAAKAGDPDSVDLSLIPEYGPIAGCSEERFAELQELAATMVDPEAGAAGNRARNKLVEAGKEAFPVIYNALKALDLTNDDEFRSADVCQKALQDLCNGSNFGWKYPSQEPEAFHYFDKKVIQSWSKAWEQAKDSDVAWAKLAKLDSVPDKEAPKEEAPETESALDALDDV